MRRAHPDRLPKVRRTEPSPLSPLSSLHCHPILRSTRSLHCTLLRSTTTQLYTLFSSTTTQSYRYYSAYSAMASKITHKEVALGFLSFVNASPTREYSSLPIIPPPSNAPQRTMPSSLAKSFLRLLDLKRSRYVNHGQKLVCSYALADHDQERDPWNSTLQPGGKYYLTRNASTLVAFAIGKKWQVIHFPFTHTLPQKNGR